MTAHPSKQLSCASLRHCATACEVAAGILKSNTGGSKGRTSKPHPQRPRSQNGTISIRNVRRLLIAATVLTLTAYLTRNIPLGVEAVTLSRFGLHIGKLDD